MIRARSSVSRHCRVIDNDGGSGIARYHIKWGPGRRVHIISRRYFSKHIHILLFDKCIPCIDVDILLIALEHANNYTYNKLKSVVNLRIYHHFTELTRYKIDNKDITEVVWDQSTVGHAGSCSTPSSKFSQIKKWNVFDYYFYDGNWLISQMHFPLWKWR